MMRSRRFIALVVVATALALMGVPARSDARGTPIHLNLGVGKAAGKSVGSAVAIGLGVTAVVIAVVGGAVWYHLHHRNQSTTTADTTPPPIADTASQPN